MIVIYFVNDNFYNKDYGVSKVAGNFCL